MSTHTHTHTKTGPIALAGPLNYYYYYHSSFHFMAIFPGESGSADSPPVLLHLFQNPTCGDQWQRVFLRASCPFCHPSITQTQSTNHNPWPDVILSSSTTGLLTEGDVLPLHHLSDASATYLDH